MAALATSTELGKIRKASARRLLLGRVVPVVLLVSVAVSVALGDRSPTRLEPGRSWDAPSLAFPLGCGEAGIDVLALVAHAVVRAVLLAVVVAAIGFVVGSPAGALAGLARGRAERGLARACDLVQSFPTFLLALVVLSAVREPSRVHLGFVFALTAWAPFARLALAQTRVLRDAAFVEAARALGGGVARVVIVHLVPNLLGVVAVQLGATAAAVVVSEAALSFVGFGARDGVSLGGVLDQGVSAMLRAPHVLFVGAATVFVTSVSLMVAGRAFDPRSIAPRDGSH